MNAADPDLLNPEQTAAFDEIMQQVRDRLHGGGHVHRPAYIHLKGGTGTGKTFLLRCLVAAATAEGADCVPTAYSAKAALAYPNGQTGHAAFKLKLPLRPNCPAYADPSLCSRLRGVHLITTDEGQLYSLGSELNQLDQIHRQLTRANFWGVWVLASDERQILSAPLSLPTATRIARSFKHAQCLVGGGVVAEGVQTFALTLQMRIQDADLAQAVSDITAGDWPAVGGGDHWHAPTPDPAAPADAGPPQLRNSCTIELPTQLFAATDSVLDARGWSLEIDAPPPGGSHATAPVGHSCIICATNEAADEHNRAFLAGHPGARRAFRRLENWEVANDDLVELHLEGAVAPVDHAAADLAEEEFELEAAFDVIQTDHPKLNGHNGSIPPVLHLKPGAPVVLTCNVRRRFGLCTDALATVVRHTGHTVTIRLRDPVTDKAVFILHRMRFNLRQGQGAVEVWQFPLQLAWAMTAHRAQAFVLRRAVVDLREPFFDHGQLGVALSRVRERSAMRLLVPHGALNREGGAGTVQTTSVVFPELLQMAGAPG